MNMTDRINTLKRKSKSKSSLFENYEKERVNLGEYLSSKVKYQDSIKAARSLSQPKMPAHAVNSQQPSDKKQVEEQNNKRLIYSIRTRKGFSPNSLEKPNQDYYFAKINFMERENYHIFCVCDGHGTFGHLVSQFVCKHLQIQLSKKILAYESTHKDISTHFPLEEIIFNAVDACVKDLHNSQIDILFSGTTCNCCIIKDDLMYVTNIGDSRSILGLEEDNKLASKALSYDHKPEFDTEKARIIKNNGRIGKIMTQNGTFVGPQRVWLKDEDYPGLAMTRSIGDLVAESVGVTWKPGTMV